MKPSLLRLITDRLELLTGFTGDGGPNDYQRGYLDCLNWLRGEVEAHERGEAAAAVAADGTDPLEAIRRGELLTMPPRHAALPCLQGRTHAYHLNAPRMGLKQCTHCQHTLPMEHGEKIAAGKNARRPDRRQAPTAIRPSATPEAVTA